MTCGVKVTAVTQPNWAVWMAGSVLATLPGFEEFMLSRENYAEEGGSQF
jgi:actin-related protein